MRVAIIYASYISRDSGTSERVLQIAKCLSDNNVYVTLSGVAADSTQNFNSRRLQVFVMPNRILKLGGLLRWFVQQVAVGLTCKYDIVQVESFSLTRSFFLLLFMRFFSRKTIIVYHDKWFKDDPRKSFTGKFNLAIQRVLLTLFDASITPGLSVKKWFKELHGEIAVRKMVVMPNGVPNCVTINPDSLGIRKKHSIGSNSFVALFFGSMTFKPNYDAAAHLYSISNSISTSFEKITGRKLLFILAGVGSEKFRKTDRFIPLGFVTELEELLSLPDVIVFPHLPSHSGPHVKTIYAFLSGKPVVATEDAVKDLPYIIPQRHFLPFDIKHPESLLDALVSISSNKLDHEHIATNASDYAASFSWENISLEHLKLYRSLLNSE
ncbi:MAG: glycosyltransferase family 4 protein [Candidatus Bathyarchaeota archaeon]|nr:glycosyltransferase family 4 protein [Candidatus Bathyarchaeota archaeon]